MSDWYDSFLKSEKEAERRELKLQLERENLLEIFFEMVLEYLIRNKVEIRRSVCGLLTHIRDNQEILIYHPVYRDYVTRLRYDVWDEEYIIYLKQEPFNSWEIDSKFNKFLKERYNFPWYQFFRRSRMLTINLK